MKFIIILIFFIQTVCYSQIDSQNNGLEIPAVPESNQSKTEDIKKLPLENKGLSNTQKNISGIPLISNIKIKTQEEEFSMIDNNHLMDPGQIFEERYKKKAMEQGLIPQSMKDQFLGEYRNNGSFVNIICRDHGYFDGDYVQVLVNDQIVIPRLLLTNSYKGFNIELSEGMNKIDFLALNQGESGPNTAELQVFDDNEVLISAKAWNLLTGVKATIMVVKEKIVIK
ncbi:MAG: hypothetical protein ACPH12_01935 [Flavobacteriaceae bacterium]